MRVLAYFIVLWGLFLFAQTARDDFRGVTWVKKSRYTGYYVERSENPRLFKDAMAYNGGRATLVTAAGVVILVLVRRADRLDPFSPDFGGEKSLDELQETLEAEERKRQRPLR